MATKNVIPPVKSTKELRSFLINQIDSVATGETSTDTAKGICNLAQQVYNTLNIELKVASAKAKFGDDFAVEALDFDA